MITINRQKLLTELAAIQSSRTQNEEQEQSSAYIFNEGRLCTFDGDCCSHISTHVKLDMAVSTNAFMELLAKLTDDELQAEIKSGKLFMKTKTGEGNVFIFEKLAFTVSKIAKPKTWNAAPEDFNAALAFVAKCAASVSGSDFVLSCVSFTKKGFEAMNNFEAARIQKAMPIKGPFLLTQNSIKSVLANEVTKMAETKEWMHFYCKDKRIVSCRKFQDEYKKTDFLYKDKGEKLVLPDELKKAADLAYIFSQEGEENTLVDVTIKKNKLSISGSGKSGKWTENVKIVYTGGKREFRIETATLKYVVNQKGTTKIDEDRLRMHGKTYQYVIALTIEDDD